MFFLFTRVISLRLIFYVLYKKVYRNVNLKQKIEFFFKIGLDKLCKKAYVMHIIYRGVEQPGSSSGS